VRRFSEAEPEQGSEEQGGDAGSEGGSEDAEGEGTQSA
jgi:hypothetical protein